MSIGRPYGPRRVAMLALVVDPIRPARYVSLDIEEGTLEDAIEHLQQAHSIGLPWADAVDIHIVETADEEVRS